MERHVGRFELGINLIYDLDTLKVSLLTTLNAMTDYFFYILG